jgi:subtilisin-like proprotein convertase family protein
MSDLAPSGTTQSIKVALDITHTYIGDLKVELIAPTGQSALLHNRKGEGQDNLIGTFDSLTTPVLSDLIGQPVAGPWELRVSDHAGQDIGKLNKWSLEVTLQD